MSEGLEEQPAWKGKIQQAAMQFGMANEGAFISTMQKCRNLLPLPATPSQESIHFLTDTFMHTAIGVMVAVICGTIGPDLQNEETALMLAKEKFKAYRQLMAKNRILTPGGNA